MYDNGRLPPQEFEVEGLISGSTTIYDKSNQKQFFEADKK